MVDSTRERCSLACESLRWKLMDANEVRDTGEVIIPPVLPSVCSELLREARDSRSAWDKAPPPILAMTSAMTSLASLAELLPP